MKKSHAFIIFVTWAVVHSMLFMKYGIRHLHDVDSYIGAADELLRSGRLQDSFNSFYIIHIGAIALFRWLFHDQILPYIIFQCIISGCATLALYKASEIIFQASFAGLVTAMIFLIWIDNIHWNTIPMTESLFCSLTCFVIFLLVQFNGKHISLLPIATLALMSLFVRPTGVLIIFGTIVYMLIYYKRYLSDRRILKWSIYVGVSALAVAGTNLMFISWDFTEQYAKGNIVTYVDMVTNTDLNVNGLRVSVSDKDLLLSDRSPLVKILLYAFNNPIEFTKTAGLKGFYLVFGIRPYYTPLHNVFNIFWGIIIYIGFYFGITRLNNEPVKYFVVSVLFTNCLLVGLSSVDWDNRFYIPMEPGIVLAAGGGLASIRNWIYGNSR